MGDILGYVYLQFQGLFVTLFIHMFYHFDWSLRFHTCALFRCMLFCIGFEIKATGHHPNNYPPPPSPHTDKHTQNNDIIAWCHELTGIVITENVTKCFICYFTLLRKMKSRGIIQTTKSSDTLRWNSWIKCNKRFSI